jgi:hypothetical protein
MVGIANGSINQTSNAAIRNINTPANSRTFRFVIGTFTAIISSFTSNFNAVSRYVIIIDFRKPTFE